MLTEREKFAFFFTVIGNFFIRNVATILKIIYVREVLLTGLCLMGISVIKLRKTEAKHIEIKLNCWIQRVHPMGVGKF